MSNFYINYYINLRLFKSTSGQKQLDQMFYIYSEKNKEKPFATCKSFRGVFLSCKGVLSRYTKNSSEFPNTLRELDYLADTFEFSEGFDPSRPYTDKVNMKELTFRVNQLDHKILKSSIRLTLLITQKNIEKFLYIDRSKSIYTLKNEDKLNSELSVSYNLIELDSPHPSLSYPRKYIQPQFEVI